MHSIVQAKEPSHFVWIVGLIMLILVPFPVFKRTVKRVNFGEYFTCKWCNFRFLFHRFYIYSHHCHKLLYYWVLSVASCLQFCCLSHVSCCLFEQIKCKCRIV